MAYCTNCGAPLEGQFCEKCGAKAGEQPTPTSSTESGAEPGAPASPQAGPPPKRSKTLMWVLVGCGGLLLVVLIAAVALGVFVRRQAAEFGSNPGFAAAKMIAAMNPDIEVIDANERTGKITLREKKTGKTVTLDFRDIQKGRISFEGDQGERVDIETEGEGERGAVRVKTEKGTIEWGSGSSDQAPDWVPRYPGGKVAGSFGGNEAGHLSGGLQIKTQDSVQKVADFYESALKTAGMKTERASFSSAGKQIISVKGTAEGGRQLVATITNAEGETTANLMYSEQ